MKRHARKLASILLVGVLPFVTAAAGASPIGAGDGDPRLPEDYFWGLAVSPFKDGQKPGDYLQRSQIIERLEIIAPYTKWVRTYGATHGLEYITEEARKLGLKVAMGTWIADGRQSELDNLVAAAAAGFVDIAVIGNEELYSGRESTASLASLLRDVRTRLDFDHDGKPDVPVTTPEPHATLFARNPDGTLKHREILEVVDVIFTNIHPFHERVSIDDACDTLDRLYRDCDHIVNDELGLNKEVVISEAGWPSEGETKGSAVPSLENAAQFLRESVQWAKSNNVKLIHFEPFDEKWKGPELFEKHWGVWDSDGQLKIPEPATLAFVAVGTVFLIARRRSIGDLRRTHA